MNINPISKITFEAKNSKINNKRKTNLLTQRHNCDSVELSKKEQPKFLKQAKFPKLFVENACFFCWVNI